jgi:5,10-methylene-tetrahydrofolate dehydrogenase/methenyl tetrahydrofolate cyclohydrolase
MTPPTRATTVVDGLALARSIRQQLAKSVARHVAAGRRPPCRRAGGGPMTITTLLRNTLSAYQDRHAWRV